MNDIGLHEQNGNPNEDVLRTAFVEMLFALAVAEAATHVADVWKATATFEQKAPAFAHLILVLLLISASWVGWRRSNSPGMKERVESVFSGPFFDLLLDVALVILYFIVARQVEVVGGSTATQPSARDEARGLIWVFSVYGIWDLKADVFAPNCRPPALSRFAHLRVVPLALVSAFASLACLILSWISLRVEPLTGGAPWAVVAADISLCAIVMLFRALKAFENPLSRLLRVTDCKAFRQPREVLGNETRWAVALLATWAGALVAATSLGHP